MLELQKLMLQYLDEKDNYEIVETEGTRRDIAETELSLFNSWLEEKTTGMDGLH